KRLEELTDSSLSRLASLKLILPTELADEYRVSGALALALPFESIDQIPAYLESLDRSVDTAPEAALDLAPDSGAGVEDNTEDDDTADTDADTAIAASTRVLPTDTEGAAR